MHLKKLDLFLPQIIYFLLSILIQADEFNSPLNLIQ